MPNGDELRIVSQGQWSEFSDKFRSGIFVVDGETGVEHMVPNSEFHYPGYHGYRLAALAYDPRTRTVVDRVRYAYVDVNDGLTEFLDGMSSEHLLIIVTHHNRYYTVSEDLEGASAVRRQRDLGLGATRLRDAHQYILIGCRSGLSDGDGGSA